MKSTSTFKSVLGIALLFLAGIFSSYSQSNAITAPAQGGVTTHSQNISLTLDEDVLKIDESQNISVNSSISSIIFGQVTRINGSFTVDLNLPIGTPVGSVIFLAIDGNPLMHVTVADILGQTEGENHEETAMRPVDITNIVTGGSNNSNPTMISQPSAPESATTGSLSSAKSLPKIDLFPNPSIDQVTIVTEGEVLWGVTEVIDITGKRILEIPTGATSPSTGIDRITIQISQLKPGTYLLRFKTNKDVYTKRFQVAR